MEELLISAVYKRKALWDPANELRKNSQILKSLWAEVAKEVGVDVNVAKNRWKNLRAYFMFQMRELEKPKSGSNKNVKTTSSWAFYNQLLFLKEVLMAQEDSTKDESLAPAQASEPTFQALTDDDCDIKNFLDSLDEVTETDKDSGSTDTIPVDKPSGESASQLLTEKECPKQDETTEQQEKDTKLQLRRAKRKLIPRSDGPMPKISRELLDLEERKLRLLERESHENENPDLLFFKSLIPYMTDFTPLQKLRLRSEIQDLILAEYEIPLTPKTSPQGGATNGEADTDPYPDIELLRPPSESSASADNY